MGREGVEWARDLVSVGKVGRCGLHEGYRLLDRVWNVMAHTQKPQFVFQWNGRVHLNRRGASVQSTTGRRGVRISGSTAGYTMFRGSVKGTGYSLHSPVFPSLPLPCVTVCHHISTGVYPRSSHRSSPLIRCPRHSVMLPFEMRNEKTPLTLSLAKNAEAVLKTYYCLLVEAHIPSLIHFVNMC